MFPGYRGIVIRDSKPIWLHAGFDHQMCMWHQHRFCNKDLKYGSLKGDTLRFVSAMDRINLGYCRADQIPDPHTGEVAARCLDKLCSELINRPWGKECSGPEGCEGCRLDKNGRKAINKHIKRHRREGYFYTTNLHLPGITLDNNAAKRVNRKFAAIRNDGWRGPLGRRHEGQFGTVHDNGDRQDQWGQLLRPPGAGILRERLADAPRTI